MSSTAGALLIAGSVIFGVGASVGVPRVFLTSDPQLRVQLLQRHRRRWRIAQPCYAGGPVVAGIGVGVLAALEPTGVPRVLLLAAAVLVILGAITWSFSCYLRRVHPIGFALGELPGWPFTAYIVATIAGLALLGGGLLAGDHPTWLGWLVLGADALFLAAYAATRDLPPFVFYVLLLVVGVVLV